MPRRFQTLDEVSSLGSADDTLVLVGEGSNADKKVSATTLKLVSIQTVSQTGHGFTLTASLPKPVFFDPSATVKVVETNINTQGESAQPFNAYIMGILDADTLSVAYAGQCQGLVIATGTHGLTQGEFYWLDSAGSHNQAQSEIRLFQVTGAQEIALMPDWGTGASAVLSPSRKEAIDDLGTLTSDPSLSLDAGNADNKKLTVSSSGSLEVHDIAVSRPGDYRLMLVSGDSSSVEFKFNNINGMSSLVTSSQHTVRIFSDGTSLYALS